MGGGRSKRASPPSPSYNDDDASSHHNCKSTSKILDRLRPKARQRAGGSFGWKAVINYLAAIGLVGGRMVHQIEFKRPYSRLEANQNLDGDVLEVRLVDETPEPGLRVTSGIFAVQSGRPIDPTHLPTRMMIGGGRRAVTDYTPDKGLNFISERFKKLIEGLEPKVHQFFPVELVDEDGGHLADHWFWVVCHRIDSVDRTQTTAILWRGVLWRPARDLSKEELPAGVDPSQKTRIVFNSEQIGAAHFWRDKYLPSRSIHCSNRAASLIREAALTGIELIEQETV